MSSGSQPEGLSDSRRWSQRSEDHRMEEEIDPHLEQVPENGGTQGVQKNCSLVSGGLRYAATTGYCLTALQAETPSLGREVRYGKRFRKIAGTITQFQLPFF